MKLELYYWESCPFCQKVFSFLETKKDSNIFKEMSFKDTQKNNEYKEELSKINMGKTQVPCLVIDGKPMLESDDIIKYLNSVL